MKKNIEIEDAVELLCSAAKISDETEILPAMECLGRVLVEDVTAMYDNPPFDRSPLDGYALCGEDTVTAAKDQPVKLKVVGKICAGECFEGRIHSGEALRIMTGAPIPEGGNAVIRQEDTDLGENIVNIFTSVKPYQNYCYAGEDYKRGDLMIDKGTRIHAGVVAVLSSLGLTRAAVFRKPVISVIATGDEVIEPGNELCGGKIYDSNLSYITARLEELGVPAAFGIHAKDDAEYVADLIRQQAKTSQLIITTGGVSVGQKDIMHDVEQILRAQHLFWRVRIKPGTPTLAFRFEDTVVVCLSGNPFGAIANFELLVRPVLAKLTHRADLNMKVEEAVLQNEFTKGSGMRRFLRGQTENGKVWINGKNQSSGAISAMVETNCLIEIPSENHGIKSGTQVKCYLI